MKGFQYINKTRPGSVSQSGLFAPNTCPSGKQLDRFQQGVKEIRKIGRAEASWIIPARTSLIIQVITSGHIVEWMHPGIGILNAIEGIRAIDEVAFLLEKSLIHQN